MFELEYYYLLHIARCPFKEKCLTNNILHKTTKSSTEENGRNKICSGITETRL